MLSLILKKSSHRSSLVSPNPCTSTNLIALLFSFLLVDKDSSRRPNSPTSCQKHSILASALSSFLLNTIRNQSGPHLCLSKSRYNSYLNWRGKVLVSGFGVLKRQFGGCHSALLPRFVLSCSSNQGLENLRRFCSFSAREAAKLSTSDGLTVDGIVASKWAIVDESESDWKSHAAAIAQSIQIVKKRLQWRKLIVRLGLLSSELNKPDLWDDPEHAGRISREHGSLMGKMKEVNAFEQELLEHIDMIKLAREEDDIDVESESLKALLQMRINIKEKELEALLSGEHDTCCCYIEVQAGAGGTESMDWAEMVTKMYKLWAERRGYTVTVVDQMPGEIAGIKRATIKVYGEYAYGYAKAEVGVHRLVRISPFDSGKRRHTSFAAVAVIPILGDGFTHVQINESDLRIERFRAGGAGGQHVNTTESAVRIVHVPTGVTATCQNERSQHLNKASAMEVLQSRLDQLEMARREQMNAQHTQSLTNISWGNQIRTYVLHPYRMVKDLRTNYEVYDPDSVLEGELDDFMLSYLSAYLDEDEKKISVSL
ncbi:hypothetical protein K2173_027008 [Erythroxylum novogranatense]|uniref:Prokaryotic-type class I peptide chain release factors domain-containing protein n=1 Tax=Erythroxylum novogranatense TaxID=1862640 RepID=A0AAV8TXV7_9ROSI|nr:hypothetical protein K2173_027008 [Erythroxylum novogranatense]